MEEYLEGPTELIDEVTDHDQLRERIARFGLGAHAELLVNLALPSIRYALDSCEQSELSERSTYFGGSPYLSDDAPWPHWQERPMAFLAQFDLALVADAGLILPPHGQLSFFYALDAQYSIDESEAGSCAVLWTPPDTAVRRRERPRNFLVGSRRVHSVDENEFEMRPCRGTGRRVFTLPNEEHPELRSLFGEDTNHPKHPSELTGYLRLRDTLGRDGAYQLCGHPAEYQNPLEQDYGLFETPPAPSSPLNWRLLLTIDSEKPGLDITLGDTGLLHIMNRLSDTLQCRFDRPWAIPESA
jgi:hypothetical protein